jgi:DNA-binding LacI/PurR family transcriptional regulator
LRAGQSPLVLAVLPFEQLDPALSQQTKELEQKLALHGLTLIHYIGVHPQTGAMHPSAHITPGVILSYADQTDPQIASFLQQFHVPVLHLLGDASMQERVGSMQATHLLQSGKRSLLFLSSDREDVQVLAMHRLRGVQQTCMQWACEQPQTCILPVLRAEACLVLRRALAQSDPPWGICCYNDEVALAALAALTDERIAIPQTAAVVGCDNIPLANWSVPALTTIAFGRDSSFDALIQTIVALSRGEVAHWQQQMTLELVQRVSA